jgi:hypothetical protein
MHPDLTLPNLAPNTPTWLEAVALAAAAAATVAALIASHLRERRVTGPYTLLAASSAQKWRWAAELSIIRYAWIPLLGLIQPLLSPLPDQWPVFPIFCMSVWLAALPFIIALKRWSLDRDLANYKRINKHGSRVGPFGVLARNQWLWTEEQRRFFDQGYPDPHDPEASGQ